MVKLKAKTDQLVVACKNWILHSCGGCDLLPFLCLPTSHHFTDAVSMKGGDFVVSKVTAIQSIDNVEFSALVIRHISTWHIIRWQKKVLCVKKCGIFHKVVQWHICDVGIFSERLHYKLSAKCSGEYYYYIHLTVFFSRTPWASRHQKGKPFWILLEQEMMEWQWHQLDHMQIICTSLQTNNHASTSPLSFYRLDALPATQPMASKHRRHMLRRM